MPSCAAEGDCRACWPRWRSRPPPWDSRRAGSSRPVPSQAAVAPEDQRPRGPAAPGRHAAAERGHARRAQQQPNRYVGQTVTVSGEVQKVGVSSGAFTLGSVGDEGDPAVVVLGTRQSNVPSINISEGDAVSVQGRVREVTARIQQDEDFLFEDEEGFNADEELFQQFKNRVASAASNVDTSVPEEDQ